MGDLLLEIGTEEIPASYITPALNQIKSLFEERTRKHLLSSHSVYSTGTPRKLIMLAKGLPLKQESTTEEIRGPASSVAFDNNGIPTKAGLGFAHSAGVNVQDLIIKETGKGKYCFATKKTEGQETFKVLPNILTDVIKHISFPKSMKWKGNGLYFARPIRSLLALFGNEIVPLEINGIPAQRFTFGHPFLSKKIIEIPKADWELYKQLLRREKVIVDMTERREILKVEIIKLLNKYNARFNEEELLDEVTNLVEYPHAVMGNFDEDFLNLPDIVIETAMKEHQRYFPVKKPDGTLIGKFIVVLNRDEKNAHIPVQGNERVLNARLYDAKFFWKEDRKTPLEKRVDTLKNLTFLEKLGNYYDRTNRIVKIAHIIAHELVNANILTLEEDAFIKRAALLCKADLQTQMVNEFPSLQGIMGMEYAKWDGEEHSVALAIGEHYMPRFATDAIPSSKIGSVVGLADKFDMISSCFALNLLPTGSQDPYSLRRHAYGIIRIIEENEFPLDIEKIIRNSLLFIPMFQEKHNQDIIYDKLIPLIKGFFMDKLYQINIERGYRHDVVNAVLNANSGDGYNDIHDFALRLKTISHISEKPYWPELVTLVERTYNIGKNAHDSGSINESLFKEQEEYTLWDVYKKNEADIKKLINEKKYEEASYLYYKAFSVPVHTFFDKVFVNVKEKDIRMNRLLLLRRINELYSQYIAHLSDIIITNE